MKHSRWARRSLPLWGLTLLLGAQAGLAEIPADERVPLTDAALLESMGFGADESVYLWTRGSYGPELTAYLSSMGVAPEPPSQQPVATGQIGFYAVAAREMQERSSGFHRGVGGSYSYVYCLDTSTDSYAAAQLQIHNGARLDFVRIWGSDHCAAENFYFWVIEYCQPDFSAGIPTATTLGEIQSSGSPGNFSLLIDFDPLVPIDNRSCIYMVWARFGDFGLSCNCGATLTLQKVRAQYNSSSEGAVHPVAAPF